MQIIFVFGQAGRCRTVFIKKLFPASNDDAISLKPGERYALILYKWLTSNLDLPKL